MEKKKGILGKVLTFVGILVALGGAVLAVLHFWDDIKAKLGCKCKDEELEDFLAEEADIMEEVADIQDDMDDFVEFEEI